jgi:hypothetical protein
MASALTFLERYHKDGDAFLINIVTGNKTWVSFVNDFWDGKGVLMVEFMQQGTTITSQVYCEILTKNCARPAIQNRRRGMLTYGVVLLHDNARPQTSIAARTPTLLEHFNWELFDHPHSPYLFRELPPVYLPEELVEITAH